MRVTLSGCTRVTARPVFFSILVLTCFSLLATTGWAQVIDPSDICNDSDSLIVRAQKFLGLRTTKSFVVERELSNSVGQIFTCAKWKTEKQSLQDLDIFADIQIQKVPVVTGQSADTNAAPTSGPDSAVLKKTVTLHYNFRELPPYIPFVAIAKTEQDGFSIGPALASLNFLGQGIRTEFISRFGGTTEFQVSLSSPRLGNLPLQYDLAVLRIASFNNFEKFEENSWRTKLDLVHRLDGQAGRKNLLYAAEIFQLSPVDSAGQKIALKPTGDYVPRLGAGFLWDSRNRRHNPTAGLYQELRITENGGWLGGPADYSEWLSDTRIYVPWFSLNTVQVASLYQYRNGIVGETFGKYDEFHLGGINTLRGFGHDAYRGKSEWILNCENRTDLIQRKILKLWKWSAYYGLQGIMGLETASIWDHNSLLENDFASSGYLGLHLLFAGVDRIRLELGSNFAKFQFQMDLGILDKPDIQRFRSR